MRLSDAEEQLFDNNAGGGCVFWDVSSCLLVFGWHAELRCMWLSDAEEELLLNNAGGACILKLVLSLAPCGSLALSGDGAGCMFNDVDREFTFYMQASGLLCVSKICIL